MASNLPPGCNSPDGGIDHAFESAIEDLCDQIDTPELARNLALFIPAVETIFKAGMDVGEMCAKMAAQFPADEQ